VDRQNYPYKRIGPTACNNRVESAAANLIRQQVDEKSQQPEFSHQAAFSAAC
jgi:hypothetical protein